jgi:predicted RNA-binding protein with PIN domain
VKVIVDAYNILHQMSKAPGDADRKHFINLLSAYAKRKQLDIIAVFDAGPYMFPATEEVKGIIVKYSGPHATADDVIVRLLEQHNDRGSVLASSDRELRDAAKRQGVESVTAQEFIEKLSIEKSIDKPLKKQSCSHNRAVKTIGETHSEVDALFNQAKVTSKAEDIAPGEMYERRAPAHKESKKERMRAQKLKKL